MKLLILIFAILAICYATSIKDELMMRVQQLNQIKDKFAEAKAGFDEFHQEAAKKHESIKELMGQLDKKRDLVGKATPECTAAVVNLLNIYTNGTCARLFGDYFDIRSTSAARNTAVNSFCNDCATPFRNAVSQVVAQCNATDFTYKIVAAIGFYPRFLCSKDDKGNLCAVVLNNVISNIPADIADVTQRQLDNFCSPCMLKALTIIQVASGFSVGQAFYNSVIILKAACVRFNGRYCILNLRDIVKQATAIAQKFTANQPVTSDEISRLMDAFCYPCFRLVSARLTLTTNGGGAVAITAAFSGLGPLCRKNRQKKYCLAVLYDVAKDYFLNPTGIPCEFSNTTACSSQCKDLITNVINKGGCCWAILVDTIAGVGAGSDSSTKQLIYSTIRSCVPNIRIPDPCPSVASANFKLVFSNIDVAWVNSNPSLFKGYVNADISRTVGGFDFAGEFSFQVSKRANTATVTVNGVTTTGTNGGALNQEASCDSTCANALAANPNEDITLSRTISNFTITSSSSIINFSFALLCILSVFLF